MRLRHAVKSGDSAAVREILENSPEVLDKVYGYRLLRRALKLNNEKIVEILIEFGVDVRFKNPLKTALKKSNARCIELLLKKGALFNSVDYSPKSLAEYVFDRPKYNHGDRKEVLELLLKYGLEVNFKDKFDRNLLHFFADAVNKTDDDVVEVAQWLLDSGVPVDDIENVDDSPLNNAIYTENIQLISFLIEKARSSTMMTSGLFKAAETNNAEIIDLFLSNGADLFYRDAYGWTALHCACLTNCIEVIKCLLRKGAYISIENNEGSTPFSFLDPEENFYIESVTAMIKEFSKLSFENQLILQMDVNLIQSNPTFQNIFESCRNELHSMSNTEFHANYSFYSVLKRLMSIKKLANLAKNSHIVCRFEGNLHRFPNYMSDLQIIWDQAIQARNDAEQVNSRLYSVFRDYLPDVVIKKLSDNLKLEDLPLE